MTQKNQGEIRDQCRQVLADYAIAVDTADAAAMIALFVETGVLVRGSVELHGHAELPKVLAGRPAGTVMRHLLTTQSIAVADDGRSARAVTYYLLYNSAGSEAPLPMPTPFSLGDWHSDLVLGPSGWKLSRQEIRRQFVRGKPE